MIILNCPKCSEAVTLASGVRTTARVRCPLCQEEYVASEALAKLPPTLVVVDDAGASAEAERPLEPTWEESSKEAAGGFAFDVGGAAGDAAARPAGPRIAARPRAKRPPKNPIVEVVKVVGGGVAGLVIAQLLLWWFPVKKYRRDPFELGPKVSKISWLSFLIPADFAAGDAEGDAGRSDAFADGPQGKGAGKANGVGGRGGLAPDNQPYSENLEKTPIDWNEQNKKFADKSGDADAEPPRGKPASKPKTKPKPAADDGDLIADDLSGPPSTPPSAGPLGVNLDVGVPKTPVKPAPPAKPADEPKAPPADEKPVDEKPADEKPAEKKPAAPPAEEKPSDTPKPAEEKPQDEKPAAPKPESP